MNEGIKRRGKITEFLGKIHELVITYNNQMNAEVRFNG